MSVKRYELTDNGVEVFSDGRYVLHTDYAALEARHNALVNTVEWMLYIDTPENFEGGKHIKARAEVDRLLGEANATLRAAAPDLYAALERLYGRLLMSDRDGECRITAEEGEMAEAALKKARGEE